MLIESFHYERRKMNFLSVEEVSHSFGGPGRKAGKNGPNGRVCYSVMKSILYYMTTSVINS